MIVSFLSLSYPPHNLFLTFSTPYKTRCALSARANEGRLVIVSSLVPLPVEATGGAPLPRHSGTTARTFLCGRIWWLGVFVYVGGVLMPRQAGTTACVCVCVFACVFVCVLLAAKRGGKHCCQGTQAQPLVNICVGGFGVCACVYVCVRVSVYFWQPKGGRALLPMHAGTTACIHVWDKLFIFERALLCGSTHGFCCAMRTQKR